MDSINQNTYGIPENKAWRCPDCETINIGDKCYTCGRTRPDKCGGKLCSCGYQNEKNAKTCERCGKILVEQDKNWRKIVFVAVVAAVIALTAALFAEKAEPHTHSWNAATCETPKTCKTCGETTGSVSAHQWKAATCKIPKTCKICGETSGSVSDHQWKEATCMNPQICKTCGETVGSVAEHQWQEATYETPRTCKVCGKTSGTVEEPPEEENIKVNDIVVFGHYEQDGNRSNGAEPIEWIVMEADENQYFLLSRYALDTVPFNKDGGEIIWKNSSVRKWLNTTFLKTAFTESERSVILTARISNSASHGNSKWNTQDEDKTEDQVYLLSYAELEWYYPYKEDRICEATDYVAKKDDAIRVLADGTKAGFWWLRSPGEKKHHAAYVNYEGDCYSNYVGNDYLSIRPALWIGLTP